MWPRCVGLLHTKPATALACTGLICASEPQWVPSGLGALGSICICNTLAGEKSRVVRCQAHIQQTHQQEGKTLVA